jgi:hypothetical protein
MSIPKQQTPDTAVIVRIAEALGETAAGPRAQIRQIVQLHGPDQALAWLETAQAIASNGGMPTSDGSRARTRGGVYFRIVRDALRQQGRMDQIDQIFRRSRQPVARRKPAPPAAPAGQARLTWPERGIAIAALGAESGKATKVKVTLIGRPGKIVERPDFTLLRMKHSNGLPALPRGIPAPSKIPETTYVVYIGAKQWRGVAEAIRQPDDVLIIEGSQFYDTEFSAITVFATSVTTRTLQQAKRQAQAERAPA